jgi:hypothetical protein
VASIPSALTNFFTELASALKPVAVPTERDMTGLALAQRSLVSPRATVYLVSAVSGLAALGVLRRERRKEQTAFGYGSIGVARAIQEG